MDVLLDNLELLHEDGSELLDDVGAVARGLQLDDDSLDDLIVDGGQIDFTVRVRVVNTRHLDGRCSREPRRGRWGICIGLATLGGRRGVVSIVDGAGARAFYLPC